MSATARNASEADAVRAVDWFSGFAEREVAKAEATKSPTHPSYDDHTGNRPSASMLGVCWSQTRGRMSSSVTCAVPPMPQAG